ncbi:MAG: hypothetical protein R3D89_00505 [Sphingomonadaceae bacterium]|jgi:hypothetical protein
MDQDNWTAGLKDSDDLFMPEPPEFSWLREGTSFWVFDDEGRFAIPRIGIEAEPHSWDNRRYQANFTLPGGRVLFDDGVGTMHAVRDQAGVPAVLGAGPIEFRCVEPWKRWLVGFEGEVFDSTVEAQIAGTAREAKRVALKCRLKLEMRVPAFLQDCSPEAFFKRSPGARRDSLSVGLGWRFEQLFAGEGSVEVDGREQNFTCTGMRVKRRSVRTDGLFLRGHCWQTAVFPDGRAFGYLAYPPHEDGSDPWNEGFVYQSGRMYPARARTIPWLAEASAGPQDVSLELESKLGITRIGGMTTLSTLRVARGDLFGLSLQQTGVEYRWDGVQAYGMLERSSVTRNDGLAGFRS